jgi:hypothetical protein
MNYLSDLANLDVELLREKERTYKSSWKKRGGVGAFMMLARKWDRLESMLHDNNPPYDIFAAIAADGSGVDGTVLAEVRDLRRYLLLVESEMAAQGVLGLIAMPLEDKAYRPGTPADGGQHARHEEG